MAGAISHSWVETVTVKCISARPRLDALGGTQTLVSIAHWFFSALLLTET